MTDIVEGYEEDLLRLLRAVRGVRVRPTPLAVAQGIAKATDRGTITGWGRHRWSVMVLKDGRKHPTSYNVTFWRPEPGARTKP